MQTILSLTIRVHILKTNSTSFFLASLRDDSSDKSQRCYTDQKNFIEQVVNQNIQDENCLMDRRRKRPHQFMRLLHDGSGTGKNLLIEILKEKLVEQELK